MNDIMDRIKKRRCELEMSYQDLAYKTGLSKSTLQRYETGSIKNMPIDKLEVLANALGVSPGYLMGWEEPEKKENDDTDLFNLKGDVRFLKKVNNDEFIKIPVLGTIRAGLPLYSDENIIDYEYVHQDELTRGEETFFLEIKGDSMINARIYECDRVRIRKQSYLENNGDIMAVRINGDEATLKRVYLQENGIALISENPKYPPMFFSKEQVENLPVEIIGKAIEVKIKL